MHRICAIERRCPPPQVFKGALSRAGTEEVDPMRYFAHGELRDLFRVRHSRLCYCACVTIDCVSTAYPHHRLHGVRLRCRSSLFSGVAK